jgi:hypothetical protein
MVMGRKSESEAALSNRLERIRGSLTEPSRTVPHSHDVAVLSRASKWYSGIILFRSEFLLPINIAYAARTELLDIVIER